MAFDFSMNTYQNNVPVEYFNNPLTVYIHYNLNNGAVNNLGINESDCKTKPLFSILTGAME